MQGSIGGSILQIVFVTLLPPIIWNKLSREMTTRSFAALNSFYLRLDPTTLQNTLLHDTNRYAKLYRKTTPSPSVEVGRFYSSLKERLPDIPTRCLTS
ncbi:MAG TPA: hypothetical protein VI278_05745 [Nitrososphaeraceae archaeon]